MPAVKALGARASCPLAGETHTLQDLGRMKDGDGMQVEVDAGRMPALPGHNRADKEWNRRGYLPHFDHPSSPIKAYVLFCGIAA